MRREAVPGGIDRAPQWVGVWGAPFTTSRRGATCLAPARYDRPAGWRTPAPARRSMAAHALLAPLARHWTPTTNFSQNSPSQTSRRHSLCNFESYQITRVKSCTQWCTRWHELRTRWCCWRIQNNWSLCLWYTYINKILIVLQFYQYHSCSTLTFR